jgi:fluoroquinolone transport system permease protein
VGRSLARIWIALALVVRVQWRASFPHVYLGIAVLMGILLRTVLADFSQLLFPLFLLGEPATLGVLLVAAQSYYDRNEGSVRALAVTPLGVGEYAIALAAATALWAVLAGLVIQAIVLGVDLRLLLLILPLFAMAVFAGLVGLAVSSLFTEFTRALMGQIPFTAVLMLPCLSYVGVAPDLAFAWVPSAAALRAFSALTQPQADVSALLLPTTLLVASNVPAAWVAVHLYRSRVYERLGVA